MKNKSMIFTAVILAISIVNYAFVSSGGFRSVEFLSIFAMGMLSGVFVVQFLHYSKIRRGKKA